MSNAKIKFTKSFKRVIKVDGEDYVIDQDGSSQSLYVFKKTNKIAGVDLLYVYHSNTNEVIYNDEQIKEVLRVLHQAQVDRYALKM